MQNYKALKSAGKASVQKVDVVDKQEKKEVIYKDGDVIPIGSKVGDIKVYAEDIRSHEELQLVCKKYDSQTGETLDDSVRTYTLLDVKREVDNCKSEVARIQSEQADWEQLEKDLKAL